MPKARYEGIYRELRDRIDKKIVVRKHLWGAQATIEA